MIDPRILQALESNDPDKRKKAVAYLAKSLDREALPHLARVYKTDKDPQIRELAKKAGAYIQKNAPEPEPDPIYEDDLYEEEEADSSYTRYNSLYADDDDDDDNAMSYESDEPNVPLPSNIQVSAVAEERAKSYVEQAMDWNVRGNNTKAIEMLKKAFKSNPRLLHDSYTMGLAVNITGLSQADTQRLLMPSDKEMRQMDGVTSQRSESRKLNGIQQFFALIIFVGATATLIGFFALPWIDIGWIPIQVDPADLAPIADLSAFGINVNAENLTTLGGSLSEFQTLLNNSFVREAESQLSAMGSQGDLIRRGLNGLRGIRTNASGMDTMLFMMGTQDILRAFGIGGIIDVILDGLSDPLVMEAITSAIAQQSADLGIAGVDLSSIPTDPDTIRSVINLGLAQLKYPTQTIDFSVIAVPVAGSFAFLLGLLLFMAPNGWIWFFCILFGLAGVGACAYFYTTAINSMFVFNTRTTGADVIQQLNAQGFPATSMTQFIGLGFWVSMGGVIAVAIAPFLGLLFAPAKQTA
ncbi:MAG: HEAT repeat domain-containing protein [bacterium]|nr:HEAT repeat domain-containing protein [bacterium]